MSRAQKLHEPWLGYKRHLTSYKCDDLSSNAAVISVRIIVRNIVDEKGQETVIDLF